MAKERPVNPLPKTHVWCDGKSIVAAKKPSDLYPCPLCKQLVHARTARNDTMVLQPHLRKIAK